jgi:hypothetical protein
MDAGLAGSAAGARAIVDRVFTPSAVRAGARAIFELAARGGTHFRPCLDRLDQVADYTIAVTRSNYPELQVPYHARHRHLRAGGIDRPAQLAERLRGAGTDEIVRSTIDLVVVSVLLDAGAGGRWRYEDPATQCMYSRSEGLAVASFDMFMGGAFSGDPSAPLRADAAGLRALRIADLERALQVSPDNPLIGAAGRLALLHGLASSITRQPDVFPTGRVSDLLDALRGSKTISAARLLELVLRRFGAAWPGPLEVGGYNLGDTWIYRPLGSGAAGLVAFHKLAQWLTYSLVVPLTEHGYAVESLDQLTGLAEYRNGGLMLDSGLLEVRDPTLLTHPHPPGSELIIEWRALTVALLDVLAERVRQRLGMDSSQLPLAAVLEGGTWHAGRKIARERRPIGEPPLAIVSDGTVF